MKYALGNMLNGAGSINPDGLALDLQFAADKTLTARRGPTPVLTRASTATFVGSNGLIQSAAINAPRFDHDPANPTVCKGLLIEESRTNILQHSANFKNTTSSSYWSNQSTTTVTVDQTTSPDGGTNADLLQTSTSSFDCFTRVNFIWSGSTQYSYSIFLKRGPSSHRYVGLYIGAGISALQFPYFDFDNPTTVQIPSGTMVGTINSTRVDAYQNGWYRVSVTFTTAATPVTQFAGVYISTSNGSIAESSTAGLNCYIWGIQAETGSFATSYIPTTTSALTRSADVCSITGAAFTSFYNQPEGTFLCSTRIESGSRSSNPFLFDTFNISNNEFGLRIFAGSVQIVVRDGGLKDFNLGTAITEMRIASAYNSTANAASLNGASVVTGTASTLPVLTALQIGARAPAIGALQINGHISSFRYYKKRLPNAKLVTLTT